MSEIRYGVADVIGFKTVKSTCFAAQPRLALRNSLAASVANSADAMGRAITFTLLFRVLKAIHCSSLNYPGIRRGETHPRKVT